MIVMHSTKMNTGNALLCNEDTPCRELQLSNSTLSEDKTSIFAQISTKEQKKKMQKCVWLHSHLEFVNWGAGQKICAAAK